MNRSQIVMVVLIVVLALVYAGTSHYKQSQEEAEEQAKRLFAELEEDDVTALTISRPEGEPLEIVQEKGRWLAQGKLLSETDVGSLANQLATLSRERELVAQPSEEELKSYGLDTPAYTLELAAKAKGKHQLALGNRTPDDNAFYARVGNQGPVYTVPSSFAETLEKEPEELREKSPLPVAPTDVRTLKIVPAGGQPIELVGSVSEEEKEEEEGLPAEVSWEITQPEKLPSDRTQVNDLLWNWKSLTAGRFLGQDETVDWSKPLLRLEATAKDQETPYVVEVGPAVAVKPGMHYVRRLDPEEVMVVDFTGHESLLSPSLQSLRDRRLAPFEVSEAQRVEGRLGSTEIAAHRDGDDWEVEKPEAGVKGDAARGGTITDLLWNLKDLRWEEPASEGTQLGEIRAQLKVLGENDENLLELKLGQPAQGGSLVEFQGTLYRLAEDPFDRWKELADRLTAAPEASPTPSGE